MNKEELGLKRIKEKWIADARDINVVGEGAHSVLTSCLSHWPREADAFSLSLFACALDTFEPQVMHKTSMAGHSLVQAEGKGLLAPGRGLCLEAYFPPARSNGKQKVWG
jgi:hypothetical protein